MDLTQPSATHATIDLFRTLALSLPGAVESAHCGHPDFRVSGRIFATLSGQTIGCGVLKLTPEQQQAFQTEMPEIFEPVHGGWGRTGMTFVHLDAVAEDTLLGALRTAHRNVTTKLSAADRARGTRGRQRSKDTTQA
jgi:predicted DNA-binding protein (MmcQ/YjbR family)